MKSLLLTFILGYATCANAQGNLVFEQEKMDLGNIIQHSGTGKLKLEVTNTGTTPVIITRTSTGDGGTFAEYQKEPISPGNKGIITFVYSTESLGPRSRTLSVTYGDGDHELYVSLPIKYQIILPPTSVEATSDQLVTKPLHFNEVDTIRFSYKNTVNKPLHMYYPNYYSINKEVLFVRLEITDSADNCRDVDYTTSCAPNDYIRATILLKNIYGGEKTINHTLDFVYNSLDTVSIPLTINSIEKATASTQVSPGQVCYYNNGELTQLDECQVNGKVTTSYYFNSGICTRTIRYEAYNKQQVVSHYAGNKVVKKENLPLKAD